MSDTGFINRFLRPFTTYTAASTAMSSWVEILLVEPDPEPHPAAGTTGHRVYRIHPVHGWQKWDDIGARWARAPGLDYRNQPVVLVAWSDTWAEPEYAA